MTQAIIKCWEERGKIDFRQWAEQHHDVADSVKVSMDVYRRFL